MKFHVSIYVYKEKYRNTIVFFTLVGTLTLQKYLKDTKLYQIYKRIA